MIPPIRLDEHRITQESFYLPAGDELFLAETANLHEALERLKADPVIQEALGPHIYAKFVEGKEREWDDYRTAVTDWELGRYLGSF